MCIGAFVYSITVKLSLGVELFRRQHAHSAWEATENSLKQYNKCADIFLLLKK